MAYNYLGKNKLYELLKELSPVDVASKSKCYYLQNFGDEYIGFDYFTLYSYDSEEFGARLRYEVQSIGDPIGYRIIFMGDQYNPWEHKWENIIYKVKEIPLKDIE